MAINNFNIRVYGILSNDKKEILLVREKITDIEFTKFPGGGLEYGEGIRNCLEREFKEETSIDVEVGEHIYTTDFFQQSAFNETEQLISVYYKVHTNNCDLIRLDEHETYNTRQKHLLRFFWVDIKSLTENMLTFPVDKMVCSIIKERENSEAT